MSYHIPDWELRYPLYPRSVLPNSIKWVRLDGSSLVPEDGQPLPYNLHFSWDSLDRAIDGEAQVDVHSLVFPDRSSFIAGQLHAHPGVWDRIAESSSYPFRSTVLDWVKNKVDVHNYVRHFKGSFKGESFYSDLPPPRVFRNHPSCEPFAEFISHSIKQRLAMGAISVWGRVGECEPPHLVMPLTVEPTKPRLCNDNRFLKLWMQDRPFSLDHLYQLPLYVDKDAYQTVCDDKSGYDHNLLTDSSRTYFGFEWGGWFFSSNTIPFGWKLSAFVCHSTGLLVSHFFRSISIPCSLYIDDRHTAQIRLPSSSRLALSLGRGDEFNLACARIACFVDCYTLVRLGYCIGLSKLILEPKKVVPYLGFESDSSVGVFRLLPEKREKFVRLLESLLSSGSPGARLYTNEINMALSRASKSSRPVLITEPLRQEMEHWLFLKSWPGFLPWRSEIHNQFVLYTDASSFAWGSVFEPSGIPVVASDYWPNDVLAFDITVKEALAYQMRWNSSSSP